MKIIRESRVIESVEYHLSFIWADMPGAGFSFKCDKNGKVDEAAMQPEALANYRQCLDGTHKVIAEGLQRQEFSYREPRVGECSCGLEVELANFTNTCECGIDYNTAGQRLAAREQWGEETGEHWTECY